ncbi:MAG: hypothetical protein LUE91_05630, partial [Oscillospiraceae bacterium]|nr:hypothetical protein [Oscillospiraceae bacterium]
KNKDKIYIIYSVKWQTRVDFRGRLQKGVESPPGLCYDNYGGAYARPEARPCARGACMKGANLL